MDSRRTSIERRGAAMTGARRGFLATSAMLAFAGAAAVAAPTAPEPSDAPDPAFARPRAVEAPATYAAALTSWHTAESVNAWIATRFEYDRARASALSESARAAGGRVAVHEPDDFFAQPRGVCVDLARFAVVTLGRVEPQSQPAYLMIEFEPLVKDGHVLRRHWLASFRRDGAWYFFADSKRPGHIAGPYASVERFIAEYAVYRGRPVVAYRITDTYERQQRKRAASPRTREDP
jgi:hypothetical protein